MSLRRLPITPGSGDWVGAIDTDADDETGNTITAQVVAVVGEDGEIVNFVKKLDKMISMQDETLDVLREILDVLKEQK